MKKYNLEGKIMYERSAIVLERYLSKIFGQDDTTGIKDNYKLYTENLE